LAKLFQILKMKKQKNEYFLKNPLAEMDFTPDTNREFNPVIKVIKNVEDTLVVEEIECDSVEDAFQRGKELKGKGIKFKIYNKHRHLVHIGNADDENTDYA
jgi:hypothetical protein